MLQMRRDRVWHTWMRSVLTQAPNLCVVGADAVHFLQVRAERTVCWMVCSHLTMQSSTSQAGCLLAAACHTRECASHLCEPSGASTADWQRRALRGAAHVAASSTDRGSHSPLGRCHQCCVSCLEHCTWSTAHCLEHCTWSTALALEALHLKHCT